ncbi:hypothetical protein K3G64_05370 [Mycobacterium sp. IDR2000157661]|nr:hypothetical protein K3G64_05370 [Mycobacterium sp. IDR2000157661]
MARPVRLVLAHELGSALDGAWWPHTGSVAGELPALIEALHKPLGEIVDLRVNWSATQGALEFDSLLNGVGSKKVPSRRHHRLMAVIGRTASAKLLVLPHMTTAALGILVMRCAAGKPLDAAQQDSQWCTSAQEVVSDAQAQSVLWGGGVRDVAAT